MIRLNDTEKIRETLQKVELCGRKIDEIWMKNDSCFHTKEGIEEIAYQRLEKFPEEERQKKSEYGNIPANVMFERTAWTDGPIRIQVTGTESPYNVLKIDAPMEGTFDIAWEKSWCSSRGLGGGNVDANVLFAPCIGHEIINVRYQERKKSPYPMPEDVPECIIDSIILILDNGVQLKMSGIVDYLGISCTDEQEQILKLPFSELKRGLYNGKDIY